MKYRITYDLDFSPLTDFLEALRYQQATKKQETNLTEAIRAAGDLIAHEWIKTAESKFKHNQGGYAEGIERGIKYPYDGDPLRYDIIHTKDYAYWLENGYESFDMKKMLETSTKVRISKEGKRYLVIPFRHGTPGSNSNPMPKDVYAEAKDMKASLVTGTYKEGVRQIFERAQLNSPRQIMGSVGKVLSYKEGGILSKNNPQKVRRNEYIWGDKLEYKGTKYDGMYRFEANVNTARNTMGIRTGKFVNKNDNEQQYSKYLTFRVMVEDSPGWIHPGLKAMNILKDTVDRVQENAVSMIADGVKKDIEQFFSNIH